MDKKRVSNDAFDTMWSFLQMGEQKANYPELKNQCLALRTLMMQKTGGQEKYARNGDISFDDLDTIKNNIVIEAMALVLSGELEGVFEDEHQNDSQR